MQFYFLRLILIAFVKVKVVIVIVFSIVIAVLFAIVILPVNSDCDISGVPVVMLVLEGGINTLQTACEAIEKNTPIIVMQGSGRAADFVVRARSFIE